MSFALIRRGVILALIGTLLAFVALRLAGDAETVRVNLTRLSDVHTNAQGLQLRLTGLEGLLDGQRQTLAGQTLQVPDGTTANDALQALVLSSMDDGIMLSMRLDTQEPGVVGGRLLWRGREAQMRTFLENLSASLPFAIITDFNLRAVVLDGENLVEMSVQIRQPWEAV
ncbi:hypothetical protein [Maricaulis sp.]|uniref:hypothetical protein n=1 Tax=Maricaulis sp. TaxID=1486257 RepID=UPI003A8F120F